MAVDFKFTDGAVQAMLNTTGLNGYIEAQPVNTGQPAWAFYTADTGLANPNALPTGTLIKWGYFASAAAFAAAANSVAATDATRRWDLVMADEAGETQTDGTVPNDAAVVAIFRDVTSAAHLVIGNMVLKGNVATSGAFLNMSNVTITTANVDFTQASCVLGMLNTSTVA